MGKDLHKGRLCRSVIVRLLFYGLFLVGPCAMSESHVLYVRAEQKSAKNGDEIANAKAYRECRSRARALYIIGMTAFVTWTVWLGLAVAWKITAVWRNSIVEKQKKDVNVV